MAVDIPHFRLPVQVHDGRFAVVEQDSLDEIGQCAETVLRYPLGHRLDLPDFGLSDQAFGMGGADMVEIGEAIETWEPRATSLVDGLDEAESLEQGISQLRVTVGTTDG